MITQGHIIKRSTDAGLTWSDVYTPGTLSSSNFGLALELEGANGVATGTNQFLAYTTNSGASWTTVAPWSHWTDLNAVDFAPSSSTVYAVGQAGKVSTSSDGGANWSHVHTGTGETLLGVSFASSSTGYVVGENATAYKTTSSGSSWTTVGFSGGTPGHLNDVVTWGSGTDAIAVGDRGAVYICTSGTFVKQTIDLDPGVGVITPVERLRDVEVVLDGSDVYVQIVGDEGLVLFRSPAGVWTAPKSQSSDTLVRAAFDAPDHGFILGTKFTLCEYD